MSARRIPVGVAVRILRIALPLCRTWRFRHPDDPGRPCRPILARAVHACWHEHLLPLAWLFADQDLATLASRDRDGEIVSRILGGLGYEVARGSSTRGGQAGFRHLARSYKEGRGVILTGDGPRGPRRSFKDGGARLAAHARGAVTAVGVAASAGWRLSTWDRFLIPAPGATVFVSLGSVRPRRAAGPIVTADIEAALAREVARCEQAAREARWARPPAIVRRRPARGVRWSASPQPRRRPVSGAPGLRRASERLVRSQWRRTRPSPPLRVVAGAYGLIHDARHGLYDSGLLRTHAAGLPVISVGGVTAGGSGKTPVAALLARLLAAEGHRPAILARGFADELELLALEAPAAHVWGHPDRVRSARRAAAEGATVTILDDGFQHRRLRRDFNLLLVDRDALRRTNGSRLPAGPFRERWTWAAARADAIISTGREPWTLEVADFERRLRARLRRRGIGTPIASAVFEAGPPRPSNAGALAWVGPPAPRLALTGIMKPNLFFAQAGARCGSVREGIPLGDHRAPAPGGRERLAAAAGRGGVLTTRKDLARLGPFLGPDLPIWVLPETLTWKGRGWEEVRGLILHAAAWGRRADDPGGGA